METVLTILPQYIAFPAWAALTAESLIGYGQVPLHAEEAKWKNWARLVAALPVLAARQVPDPQMFADWRLWAVRLNEALYDLGV